MKAVKFLVRALVLAVVAAAFFGMPFCHFALKSQRLLWAAAATLVFGRFFCDVLCPLGILQSLVGFLRHPKSHVRRVCTRLPETRTQRIVRWSVLALFAAGLFSGFGAVTLIAPISVFGKAVTLWWPGVALFAAVLGLSLVGDGRIWCNWICPYGTLFSLISRLSPFKNRVGAGCGNCRRCFAEKTPAERPDGAGVSRRDAVRGMAVLAVAEKLTDGGYADVSLPGVPDRGGFDILPPGAGDARRFAYACVGCQLCVANCPGNCLKPSVKLSRFGQPVMDFRGGYCIADCVKCVEVCPEGALGFLQREQRPNVHMGFAEWKKDLCVRTTDGDPCTACVRKCPVQAIHLVGKFPVVDRDACIGCGACEHVCPARPMPAIFVRGVERQRVVNPISEADLVAEMRARIASGAAVVVAKGGVIVAEEKGRGLEPLLRLEAANGLRGAVVLDKVTGRAAAAVCLAGGARKVVSLLASRGAERLFASKGVPFAADRVVDEILNHDRTGGCPMEKVVEGMEDPAEMLSALRKVRLK